MPGEHVRPLVLLGIAFARRQAGELFGRSRDTPQRCAEIGEINQGKNQSRHPEQMDMSEQGEEPKHCHDFELHFLRPVRHAFGKSVEA